MAIKRQGNYEPNRLSAEDLEELRLQVQTELDRIGEVVQKLAELKLLPQAALPPRYADGTIGYLMQAASPEGAAGMHQVRANIWRRLAEQGDLDSLSATVSQLDADLTVAEAAITAAEADIAELQNSLVRKIVYSGDFPTVSNGQTVGNSTASIFANAGDVVSAIYTITGRPDAFGHTYVNLRVDGVQVLDGAVYGNTTWIRTGTFTHSFVAPTSKTYTIDLWMQIGSGATTFGNGNRSLHWEVSAGKQIV